MHPELKPCFVNAMQSMITDVYKFYDELLTNRRPNLVVRTQLEEIAWKWILRFEHYQRAVRTMTAEVSSLVESTPMLPFGEIEESREIGYEYVMAIVRWVDLWE